MSDGPEGATKGLGLFSALESATHTPFFLLAMTFALLVDSTLVHFNHSSLLELARNPDHVKSSSLAIEVILIFIGFSFLTSIILPILAIPADELLIPPISWASSLWNRFLSNDSENFSQKYKRRYDYVTPWELRKEAHELKDSYLLGLYAKYDEAWHQNRKMMFKTALYGFYALVMAFVNYFVVSSTSTPSLLGDVATYFGSAVPVWAIIASVFVITYSRYWKDVEREWIFCPTLYRTLEARDEAAKAAYLS